MQKYEVKFTVFKLYYIIKYIFDQYICCIYDRIPRWIFTDSIPIPL